MARWNEGDLDAYKRNHPRQYPADRMAQEVERPPSVQSFTVQLPIPPSVNHLYDNAPGKGRILTREAKLYKSGAAALAARAAREQGWYYMDGHRLSLTIELHFLDARRDITNTVKVTEDSIAEALGFNDALVDELYVRRAEVRPDDPHCLVTLAFII